MNAASTVALLEQCLPLTEDRYLRCLFGEPWGPLTMCGALVLLKVHLGSLTRPAAKAYCAQRFLDLHCRHFARQQEQQEQQEPPDAVVLVSASLDGGVEAASAGANQLLTPSSASAYALAHGWLESWYPDLDMDSLDIDMDWGGAGWELPLWYSPDGDRLGQASVHP
ncbi:hypothetical protein B0T26DRAFT_537811 [Lasiosphaeria miniovina]|uniref:Uncharacterized protein n=1 Tax=Lasiosphaeria miniovina TaxID=1954250 RepID=A0AA40DII1_9PEZI|nr:uncharacterized protein B0T26DRAFT_537811 [Lasiosphaeria miniovina]KAK0701977.1 hypothetical protein B0T26DRAFT_537811 [Lasiosphaeria miniovina]